MSRVPQLASLYEDAVVDALVDTDAFVHVTASGAGTQIVERLWARPGASAWLSGGTFPYSEAETREFLGFKPSGVNPETALDLALEAYGRAAGGGHANPIGLSLTASVASTRPHRGDHRVHAAVVSNTGAWRYDVVLNKGVGRADREFDDDVCTDIAFYLLGIAITGNGNEVAPEDLTARVLAHPVFTRTGERATTLPDNAALMPGAYNPPHAGHLGVAKLIEDTVRFRVVHHIVMDQPHKPPVTAQQAMRRARLLRGRDVVFTAGDVLYVDQGARFPGTPLVLGADSLGRMFDPQWGLSPAQVARRLHASRTWVYAVDRVQRDGTVLRVIDVLRKHPAETATGFTEVGGGVWADSSSELRAAASGA